MHQFMREARKEDPLSSAQPIENQKTEVPEAIIKINKTLQRHEQVLLNLEDKVIANTKQEDQRGEGAKSTNSAA